MLAADLTPDTGERAVIAARARATVLVGELALDGRLRPVRGLVARLLAVREAGEHTMVIPAGNLPEAAAVAGVRVLGADRLRDVVGWLRGQAALQPGPAPLTPTPGQHGDLSDVVGNDHAKTALGIAAAGGHHLLLLGPPGAGATMLAQRLPGLLPRLSHEQAVQVAAIRSVAGQRPVEGLVSLTPPFVTAHHSTSMGALLGGGGASHRPGAVSLAHHGVLFMNEAPEFAPHLLEALRTPLEQGEVRLAHAGGPLRYPARFQLVMAAAPCPCGAPDDQGCVCSGPARRRYRARLAPLREWPGGLAARLTPPPAPGAPTAAAPLASTGDTSAAVRARVLTARAAAAARWAPFGCSTNAQAPSSAVRGRFRPPLSARTPLEDALRAGALSPYGAEHVVRLAWTLADLAGASQPDRDMISRALASSTGWSA